MDNYHNLERIYPYKSGSDVPPIPMKPNRAEASSQLDIYLSNPKKKPPLSIKTKIMQEIASRKIDAAKSRNYLEASKLSKAERDLKQYYHELQTAELPIRKSHVSTSSSNQLRNKLKREKLEYERRIQECNDVHNQIIDELKKKHEKEVSEFGIKWSNPHRFQEFAKPSPRLLQLREIERQHVLLNDYEAAAKAKKLVDEIVQQESGEAQSRAEESMQIQLRHMQKRHEKELLAVENMTKKKLRHIEIEGESIIKPIERALKKAEEVDVAPPIRRSAPASALASARPITSRLSTSHAMSSRQEFVQQLPEYEEVDLATPRTFHKIMEMRSKPQVTALELNGIDISKYLNQKRRNESAAPPKKPAAPVKKSD